METNSSVNGILSYFQTVRTVQEAAFGAKRTF